MDTKVQVTGGLVVQVVGRLVVQVVGQPACGPGVLSSSAAQPIRRKIRS